VNQLKAEVANTENDIFDAQGKLEKLGRETDMSAAGPDSYKAKAMRELDENVDYFESEKLRVEEEIAQIEAELDQTMEGIKMLGLVTLQLEDELELSWDIVRKTSSEVIDKRDVTRENVTAFMS